MMKRLINKAIKEYQLALELDNENTDALFFICEELGENLDEKKFNLFCNRVNEELNKKGMN